MYSFIFRFHFASRRINNKINYFLLLRNNIMRSIMFNNIKWWAGPDSANWCLCEWEERVVASNVPLVQYI